jgi:hypothetical protein
MSRLAGDQNSERSPSGSICCVSCTSGGSGASRINGVMGWANAFEAEEEAEAQSDREFPPPESERHIGDIFPRKILLIDIRFSHLRNDIAEEVDLKNKLYQIATSWTISAEQVATIDRAAHLLLVGNHSFKKLLKLSVRSSVEGGALLER